MSRLEELRTAYRESSGKLEAIRDARMKYEGELRAEASRKVREKYGADETAASMAYAAAENAFHAEEARLRAEENARKLPHPEGTVLVEWKTGSYYSDKTLRASRKAVLQIYRDGDPLPGNIRWHRPQVGSIVLRILKKDGKPGSAVESVPDRGSWFAAERECRYCWLPEGKEPKQ